MILLFHQSQQKQMHEILKHLSQQDEKNKESQQSLGQQLNSETQKQSCLIEQLKQMVAEREAKVKELEEEVGQLTLQVNLSKEMNYQSNSLGSSLPVSKHAALPCCLRRLLAQPTSTCPLWQLQLTPGWSSRETQTFFDTGASRFLKSFAQQRWCECKLTSKLCNVLHKLGYRDWKIAGKPHSASLKMGGRIAQG